MHEKFCKDLRQHATKIINYEKKDMIPLTKKEEKSHNKCDRSLPTGKNKKVIGLMKDELGGRVITEFVALRPKTYSYLTDSCKEDKKAKGTKKCVIKRMIKFYDYKNCLLNGEVILKSQQRFISKGHDVYTKNINKIALSSNGDKGIVSSDKLQVNHNFIISKIPKTNNNTQGIGGST